MSRRQHKQWLCFCHYQTKQNIHNISHMVLSTNNFLVSGKDFIYVYIVFFLQREAQEAQNSFTTRPQTRPKLQFTLWHGNQSARGAFWDNFFLTWTLPPFPMSTQMNSQGSGPTHRVPKDPWSATGSLHPNWSRASPIFIWHHSVKGHTL